MTVIAFFNSKGDVGTTSLVYHLAWMFSEQGLNVIAADLDPQANLTSMFLDEPRLEQIWSSGGYPSTIQAVIEPVLRGEGDIRSPHIEEISSRIGLINGDLALANFEEKFAQSWSNCHNRDEAAFRAITAFYRTVQIAATERKADVILLDIGPNLGAINRSALIASQFVIIPLAPDLTSLQGLRTLGSQLRKWRQSWAELKVNNPFPNLKMPSGEVTPAGYILVQQSRRGIISKRYEIATEYCDLVLQSKSREATPIDEDPNCLGTLKNYLTLIPIAREVKKPIFHLKPADGAIGANQEAVRDCWLEYSRLATRIRDRCGF